jgi:hypothetical protein
VLRVLTGKEKLSTTPSATDMIPAFLSLLNELCDPNTVIKCIGDPNLRQKDNEFFSDNIKFCVYQKSTGDMMYSFGVFTNEKHTHIKDICNLQRKKERLEFSQKFSPSTYFDHLLLAQKATIKLNPFLLAPNATIQVHPPLLAPRADIQTYSLLNVLHSQGIFDTRPKVSTRSTNFRPTNLQKFTLFVTDFSQRQKVLSETHPDNVAFKGILKNYITINFGGFAEQRSSRMDNILKTLPTLPIFFRRMVISSFLSYAELSQQLADELVNFIFTQPDAQTLAKNILDHFLITYVNTDVVKSIQKHSKEELPQEEITKRSLKFINDNYEDKKVMERFVKSIFTPELHLPFSSYHQIIPNLLTQTKGKEEFLLEKIVTQMASAKHKGDIQNQLMINILLQKYSKIQDESDLVLLGINYAVPFMFDVDSPPCLDAEINNHLIRRTEAILPKNTTFHRMVMMQFLANTAPDVFFEQLKRDKEISLFLPKIIEKVPPEKSIFFIDNIIQKCDVSISSPICLSLGNVLPYKKGLSEIQKLFIKDLYSQALKSTESGEIKNILPLLLKSELLGDGERASLFDHALNLDPTILWNIMDLHFGEWRELIPHIEKLEMPKDFSMSDAARAINMAVLLLRAHRPEKGLQILQSVSEQPLKFSYSSHNAYLSAFRELYNTEFENRETILKKLLAHYLKPEQILAGSSSDIIIELLRSGTNKKVIIDFIKDLTPIMTNMALDTQLRGEIKNICQNICKSIAALPITDSSDDRKTASTILVDIIIQLWAAIM